MTIELWWTGKTSMKYLEPGISLYTKRIKHFNRFEIKEFTAAKVKRAEDQAIIDDQNILKHLDDKDYLILLDEKGSQMTSVELAKYIDQMLTKSVRKIVFLIGGAYGFGDQSRKRADAMLALSPLTFTHDMVRLVFLEQLYRAFTINHNLLYHH